MQGPSRFASLVLALAILAIASAELAVNDAAAYALLNFHLGAGSPPESAGEHIVWDPALQGYRETGPSGVTLSYVPIATPTRHGASPANPYPVVRAGGSLVDVDDS